MNRQKDLKKETQAQAQKEQQAQKKMLEEQLKQKLDEIKDEVTQLRRDVDALALAPWTTRSDDDLNTY